MHMSRPPLQLFCQTNIWIFKNSRIYKYSNTIFDIEIFVSNQLHCVTCVWSYANPLMWIFLWHAMMLQAKAISRDQVHKSYGPFLSTHTYQRKPLQLDFSRGIFLIHILKVQFPPLLNRYSSKFMVHVHMLLYSTYFLSLVECLSDL